MWVLWTDSFIYKSRYIYIYGGIACDDGVLYPCKLFISFRVKSVEKLHESLFLKLFPARLTALFKEKESVNTILRMK
jgi:hypothetical protein